MVRGAAVTSVVLTLAWLWLASGERGDVRAPATDVAVASSSDELSSSVWATDRLRPTLERPIAAASWRGTRVDGRLRATADGELELSHHVLRMFDYALSSRGELSMADIRAMVAAQTRGLPARVADDALSLFDTYVSWQTAVTEVASTSLTPRQYLDRVVELQREFFDDRAEDLFRRRNLIARMSLDRQDRPDDAKAIDAALPPRIRRGLARMRAPGEIRRRVAAMRANGASDSDVWHVRARAFGAAAANRLAQLDRTRR